MRRTRRRPPVGPAGMPMMRSFALAADVDTLAPYRAPGGVSLRDRRSRLELVVFPRGWSEARPFGRERVVLSEERGRVWVMRIEGARRRGR